MSLGRAASAVWAIEQNSYMEYELDGSGELGDKIALSIERAKRRAVEAYGYTPESYNKALEDALDSWHWIQMLSIEDIEDRRVVCTLGYPGHPGAEYSTIGYLKQ